MGGGDLFIGAEDSFRGGDDLFRRGEDLFRRGEDLFRMGEDLFRRGEDLSGRGEDLFRRGAGGQFGCAMGSLWEHFGITLGLVWDHFADRRAVTCIHPGTCAYLIMVSNKNATTKHSVIFMKSNTCANVFYHTHG